MPFTGSTLTLNVVRDTQTTTARAAQTWSIELPVAILVESFVADIRSAGDYDFKIDGVTVASVASVAAATNSVTFTLGTPLELAPGEHELQLTCGSTVQWYNRGNLDPETAVTGTGEPYVGWGLWDEQPANFVHGSLSFKVADGTLISRIDGSNTSGGSFAAQTWDVTFDTDVVLHGVIKRLFAPTTYDFSVDGGSVLATSTQASSVLVHHSFALASPLPLAAGTHTFKIDPPGSVRFRYRSGTTATPTGDAHLTTWGVWAESTGNKVDARIFYSLPAATEVSLGLPAEVNAALPFSVNVGETAALGLPTEADAALPVTPAIGAVAALGLPAETDEAYPIADVQATVVPLGLPTETDSALPVTTAADALAQLGLPTETDEALAIAAAVGAIAQLGLPTETDEALPVAVVLLQILGLPTELDEALGFVVLSDGAVIPTQTWNRAGGRVRHASAELVWDPPPALESYTQGADAPFARIYNNLVIDQNGNTLYDAGPETYVTGPMLVPQLIVNGKDVSRFRGLTTPVPDFEFDSPLGYGPAIWTFECIPPHEMMPRWEGDDHADVSPELADWCFPDAPCKVKWWDVSGETPVLKPELTWHGLFDDFLENDNNLQVIAGGYWSGQAAMRDLQLPLFGARADIRRQLRHLAEGIPGVQLVETEDTGIVIQRFGGMRHLEAITTLLSTQTKTKGPFTIMPETWGTRRFTLSSKSTAEIHATFYGDGTTMRLQRERVREPDRFYGYGVTPGGQRVRNGRYPGVLDDPQEFVVPADYPFFDESAFGLGTTDADTDTGDGITVMQVRLQTYGLLAKDDVIDESGTFGIATEGAVNRLRFMVTSGQGLLTGMMTPNFWNALYNVARIGSSIWWSKVEPMAQRPWTIKWQFSVDGSIIGKNDAWEGDTRRMVDKTTNYGAGWTRGQMFDFSEQDLEASTGPCVFGELDLSNTGGLLRGSVDPGTAVTDEDFMHQLEVRPCMNIRLPYTRWGDIVVQVSTVPVKAGKVVAKVSSRPLDSIPLWEAINATRERRVNTEKVWWAQNRSSSKIVDSVVEFEEIGGQMHPRPATGGQWVVWRVLAGQIGMFERFRLHTEPDTTFVAAIFGREITAGKLNQVEPNPLASKSGWKASMEELNAEHLLLYLVGEPGDLAGYSPGRQADSDPVTGRVDDPSGFPYKTGRPDRFSPWVYIAAHASDDTTFHGGDAGRVLWNQELVGI